jgi:hypothetical protein
MTRCASLTRVVAALDQHRIRALELLEDLHDELRAI